MKFLCCADLHIGSNVYGEVDPATGIHDSSKNLLDAVDQLIDHASKNQIRTTIVAGDIFHRRNPSAIDWMIFKLIIKKFIAAQIHLYVIPGNHDDSSQFTTALGPLSLLENHEYVHFIEVCESIRALGNIILLPYVCKRWTHLEAEEFLAGNLISPNSILICHENIVGAKYRALNTFVVAETGLTPEFLSNRFKLTLAGHFHAYQQVKDNIFYCGPLIHLDFNDYQTTPGFLEVDSLTFDVKHIPVQTRKFIQFEGNVKDLMNFVDTTDVEVGDVVKIKVVVEDSKQESALQKCVTFLQKKAIVSFVIYRLPKKVLRNAEITFEKAPRHHLEMYAKTCGWSEEVIKVGQQILEGIHET